MGKCYYRLTFLSLDIFDNRRAQSNTNSKVDWYLLENAWLYGMLPRQLVLWLTIVVYRDETIAFAAFRGSHLGTYRLNSHLQWPQTARRWCTSFRLASRSLKR